MSRLALRMSGPIPESTHAKMVSINIRCALTQCLPSDCTRKHAGIRLTLSAPRRHSRTTIIAKFDGRHGLSKTDAEKLIVSSRRLSVGRYFKRQASEISGYLRVYCLLMTLEEVALAHWKKDHSGVGVSYRKTLSVGQTKISLGRRLVVVARSAELGAANKLLARSASRNFAFSKSTSYLV